jgi:hypothetical protein
MKTFWLSFVDGDRAPGQQFLGVAIVDITDEEAAEALVEVQAKFPHARDGSEWLAAASRKAHLMACNPGGEMLSVELLPEHAESLPRYRLLSRDELTSLGEAEHDAS